MILNRQRDVRVALRPLKRFLGRVQRALRLGNTDVTICLVSEAEIARMNRTFRRKKGPTDVLSFPSSDGGGERRVRATLRRNTGDANRRRTLGAIQSDVKPYLGDIAIAPRIARRNAKEDGRPFQAELQVLILHGVLHLLGYDHETDQGQMKRIEERLRKRFRLP